MLQIDILIALSFLVLITGSYTDLKTREVPDWVNYGLIFAALGIRAIFSAVDSDWSYLAEGLFGFSVFFSLAALLFFTGQWGGGDSKLLMGLGAAMGLGISPASLPFFGFRLVAAVISFIVVLALTFIDPRKLAAKFSRRFSKKHEMLIVKSANAIIVVFSLAYLFLALLFLDYSSWLISFIVNLMVIGGLYGVVWSIALLIKNWRSFIRSFARYNKQRPFMIAKKVIAAASIICIILALALSGRTIRLFLLFAVFFMYITYYLWVIIRSVEEACMVKAVPVNKLTEGDWIVEDIFIDDKRICGPSDLGISAKQIKKLKRLSRQKKISRIKIKEGIPFVPSFLLAFAFTYFYTDIFIDIFFGFIMVY